jgi:hypothetical protein
MVTARRMKIHSGIAVKFTDSRSDWLENPIE